MGQNEFYQTTIEKYSSFDNKLIIIYFNEIENTDYILFKNDRLADDLLQVTTIAFTPRVYNESGSHPLLKIKRHDKLITKFAVKTLKNIKRRCSIMYTLFTKGDKRVSSIEIL